MKKLEQKQEEAKVRQEKYNSLTLEQKMSLLSKRKGESRKERKRLREKLQAELRSKRQESK